MSVEDLPCELRVHGVGGPQAAKMLGQRDDRDVVTLGHDPLGRQVVPTDTRFVRRVPDDGTEAYEWGGLTTGSWVKALWVLYLPFTLVNAAGWAHHPVGGVCGSTAGGVVVTDRSGNLRRAGVRVHVVAVHALAVLATLTYVLWIAYLLLDLVAVRWRRHVLAEEEVEGFARDAAGAWVPVLAPVLFVALVAALALAPVLKGRFEQVGCQDDRRWPLVPPIAQPWFFALARCHRKRQVAHLAVGGLTAAGVVVLYAAGAHRIGLLLVVVGALQAAAAVILLTTELVGRWRQPTPGRIVDDCERAPGAWSGWQWIPAGTAFAVIGSAIAHSAFAGAALLFRKVLASWPDPDPPDVLDVGVELRCADIIGGAIPLFVAISLVIVLCIWRAPQGGVRQPLMVRAARRSRLFGLALLTAIAVPTGYFIQSNARGMRLGANPLLWWTRFVDWYDRFPKARVSLLQLIGAAVLVALPPLAFLVLRRPHTSGVGRVVGNIWDVLTFWPRRFHPMAVPPSAEQAVPELRGRIEETVSERSLVVVGHSQGSVIAAAAIASCTSESGRVRVVTFGSPLGTLFVPTWPAYVPQLLEEVEGRQEGRWPWVNFWRSTDPIGAGVPGAVNQRLEDPRRPAAAELDEAHLRPPLERPPRPGVAAGHSGYLSDPCVRAAIAERCRTPPAQDP